MSNQTFIAYIIVDMLGPLLSIEGEFLFDIPADALYDSEVFDLCLDIFASDHQAAKSIHESTLGPALV